MTTVRLAKASDCEGIARVLRSIEWLTRFQGEPLERTAERVCESLLLCQRDDSHAAYVAEAREGARILGYGLVHWLPYFVLAGVEGYVSDLFVHAESRGQGVGSRLLAKIKEDAADRGCCRLSLLNGRERESYGRRFYEKSGWEERAGMANFVLRL